MFSDSRSVLHGKALSEALAWFKRYAPELDASERDFIKRSRRSRWRRRLFVGTMMPFGTVLLGLAIYAGYLGWIWACTEFNLWRIHNGTMALPPEPAMVTVPAGEFQMGSSPTNDPDADPAEMPQHLVKLSKPFLIGAYEVTFEEYDAFIQMTGRLFQKPDDFGWGRGKWPVIGVSWTDARAYAEFLSYATGKHYRLPTEAEWEYAARAGTDTPFWWGKDAGRDNANCSLCGNTEGVGQKTLPVGTFRHNPLGLYDTAGNVGEWVQDCWHENYNGAPSDESAWSATNCYQGVIRGGSWLIGSRFARSATRGGFTPDWRFNSVGFRLAQDLD